MPFDARDFEPSHHDDIARFVSECTGGAMDPAWVTEVVTRVVTDAQAVRQLCRDDELVGVGVAIDGLETEGNAGELSVFTQPAGDPELTTALLDWGQSRVRSAGRSRVDVPHWPNTALPRDVLEARGFRVGHIMYNMHRADAAGPYPTPRTPLPSNWCWAPAGGDNLGGYYQTLRAAWQGLPSAFVEPEDKFREGVARFDESPELLLSSDAQTPVAAFIRVVTRSDGGGEVAALGRHPRYRGYGIGEHLMVHGLTRLHQLGAAPIVLEVAASNASGLTLYQSFGFEVSDEMNVYSLALE